MYLKVEGERVKKLIIYIFSLVILCFVIPIIFTIRFDKKEVSMIYDESTDFMDNNVKNDDIKNHKESDNNLNDIVSSDYKKYNTVKVYHTKSNDIQEMILDEYLYGVVSAEMPASFEKEALKAQSIVARTYTIYKIINNAGKHEGADICDDSNCCQAWLSKEDRFKRWSEQEKEENWNKILSAVNETKGKIITYEGKPINAFFHSNSGGTTEIPINVWGGSNYPYLQAVATSGEDGYMQYYSEVLLSEDDLVEKMKEKYSDFSIDFENDDSIKIIERNDSRKNQKHKNRK